MKITPDSHYLITTNVKSVRNIVEEVHKWPGNNESI